MADYNAGNVTWNLDLDKAPFNKKLASSKGDITSYSRSFTSAEKSVNGSFASMAERGGSATDLIGSGFLSVIGKVVRFGAVAAAAASVIGGLSLGSLLTDAGRLQQTNAGFQTLIGNTRIANDLFAQLYGYANRTPFEASQITSAARTILGFGADAQTTYRVIQQLGDIAGATGGDLSSLALVAGQIFAQGKVQAQDFYQIINSGAGALGPLIAKNLGYNGVGALRESFEQGKVTSQAFFDALTQATAQGGFAFQGAQKQAETFNGRLSTLKDAATQAGLSLLGVHVDPQLGLTVAPGGIFDRLSRLVTDITTQLSSPAFQNFASTMTNGIVAGVNGFITVAGTAVGIVTSFVRAFREGNPFVQFFAVFIGAVVVGIALYNIAMAGAAFVTGLFGVAMALVTSPVFLVVAAIAAIIAVGYLLVKHWDAVKAFGIVVWNGIRDAAASAFNWVKDNWPLMLAIITGPLGLAVLYVARHWDAIKNGAAAVVGAVGNFFGALPGRILSAVGNLGSILYESGKSLIQGLLNGAGSLLSTVGSFFLNALPGWIRDPFKRALGIRSPSTVFAGFGRNVVEGLANGITGSRGLVDSSMNGLSGSLSLGSTMSIGTGRGGRSVVNPVSSSAAPATARSTSGTTVNLHMDGIMARSRSDLREIATDMISSVNESLRARRLPEIGGGAL